MKLLGRILFFLVIVIVLIVVFKNAILKAAIPFAISKAAGVEADLGGIDLNFSKTLVDLQDLKVQNPSGFEDKYLIDIPQALVDYELEPLFKGNVHLTDVKLYLKELMIVRNDQGLLNINVIREKLEQNQKKEATEQVEEGEAPPAEEPKKTQGEMKIDNLSLKIDRVIYKDYTVGKDPLVQEFDLNIEENHQNITEIESIIGIIMTKALRNSAIARLTNLNPEEFLQSNIFDTATMANQAVTKIGDTAMSTVESQLGSATGTVKDTADAVVGSLKDKVKLPFGKSDTAQ